MLNSYFKIPDRFIDLADIASNVDDISQNLYIVHSFIEVVSISCEEDGDIAGCGALMMAAELLEKQIDSLELAVRAIYEERGRNCACPLLPVLMLADRIVGG